MPEHEDPGAEARRQIVRRATLYTAGFIAAAVGISIIGAAVVAWLLTFAGQPFLRTWLVLSIVIALPGLLGALWKLVRAR
jgi:hypothetical protein